MIEEWVSFPNLFIVEIDNIARLSSGGSVTVQPSDAVCKGTSRQWPSGDGSGDEANV